MRSILKTVGGCGLLLSSTAALAYLPVGNNVPADADISLTWGGATASSLTAQEAAVSAVCASNADLIYVTGGAFNDANDAQGNDWVLFCITNSTLVPGLPAGDHRVMVVKRDRGGSGVGVGPVQVVDAITTLNVPAGGAEPAIPPPGCVQNTPGVENAPIIPAPGGGNVPLFECPATYNIDRNMEMGTSDIEPDKFTGINTPVVDGISRPFLPGAANGFDALFDTVPGLNPLAALVFNTPVTLQLRNRLQTVQFEAGSAEFDRCNPGGANYGDQVPLPVGNLAVRPHTWAEDEACMPSLTQSEIASIMTGRIVNWNQLRIDNGAAQAGNITGAIQICRRTPGSGSQATLNALWMHYPCDQDSDGSVNVVLPRAPSAACAAPFAAGQVYDCSGSSDVDTCLHTLDGTANPLAIGILSVEGRNVVTAPGTTRNWRYIKINGVAPTLRNVHAADYEYYAEQSCQFKRRTLPAGFNQVGGVNTLDNKRRLFNRICCPGTCTLASIPSFNNINLGTAAPSTNPNTGAVYTWGQSGWLITPTTALVPDNVLNVQWPIDAGDRPVNMVTRLISNATNICAKSLKTSAGGATTGLIVEPNPEWDPAGNDKLPELPDPYPNTEDDEDNGPDNAP